jgi:hypothetical protein
MLPRSGNPRAPTPDFSFIVNVRLDYHEGRISEAQSAIHRSRKTGRAGVCHGAAPCADPLAQTPTSPVSRRSIRVGLNARAPLRGYRPNLTREEPRQGRGSSRWLAISMHRVPTLDPGSAGSPTALQYHGVGHKHCCSEIARLPSRRPWFACGGSRRQPLPARLMQPRKAMA